MNANWKIALNKQLDSSISLEDVSRLLIGIRDSGISQTEVRTYLNDLRLENQDDVTDDRILEILDIVEGFCNKRLQVW